MPAANTRLAVATVGDAVITLRELEDELLRREGRQFLDMALGNFLDGIDWAALEDDETLVSIRGHHITRLALVVPLLQRQGDAVRGELISIAMTEQALARHGISLGPAVIQAELERQDAQFRAVLEREGQPAMAFRDYIQHSQGMTLADYVAQDGFRIAAGLHELVHRLAEVPDQALREHYARQIGRFSRLEGVETAIIRIPYRRTVIGGQDLPDPGHVRALRSTMNEIRSDILAQDNDFDFARAWQVWGRAYDQSARDGGAIGWVDRNGEASVIGVEAVPPTVTEAIFTAAAAAQGDEGSGFPQLLEPIAYPDGVALVMINGYREADRPSYEAVHELVRRDYIEANLGELTSGVLQQVRRDTEVVFESFPPLVQQRQQDLVRMVQESAAADQAAE